jgi:hypothetical protein
MLQNIYRAEKLMVKPYLVGQALYSEGKVG